MTTTTFNPALDVAVRASITNNTDRHVTLNAGLPHWRRIRLKPGGRYITISAYEIAHLWHPGASLRPHLAAIGLEVQVDWTRRGEPISDPFEGLS